MSQGAWGPDPYGRHQHRYWSGQHWTEHVADDGVPGVDPAGVEGPLRGEDADNGWPIRPPSRLAHAADQQRPPARIGPRVHALLAVLTLGLWLLLLPALMLWRRGWPKGSILAGAGAAALIIAGATGGTDSPPPPQAQSLVGEPVTVSQPPASQVPAATTAAPVKATSSAAPRPTGSAASTAKTTGAKTAKPTPKKATTTKKPSSSTPAKKKTTAPPPQPADRNCSDFATHAQAQAWFDKYYPYYGDFANLDADGDGIACESLP